MVYSSFNMCKQITQTRVLRRSMPKLHALVAYERARGPAAADLDQPQMIDMALDEALRSRQIPQPVNGAGAALGHAEPAADARGAAGRAGSTP